MENMTIRLHFIQGTLRIVIMYVMGSYTFSIATENVLRNCLHFHGLQVTIKQPALSIVFSVYILFGTCLFIGWQLQFVSCISKATARNLLL